MPAPAWAFDLQGVRALAHRLYCSCQEPSSIYRPLAKSIRTLRNKLEEADDALDETSARAEDIEVLQAAGESRVVLQKLERAIQRERALAIGLANVENEPTADLLNDIDEVIRRLCTALETLERLNGNLGLLLNSTGHGDLSSTQTPISSSSFTTNSEDGNLISTSSSSWSFSSKRTSLSKRLSVNSEATTGHQLKPDEEKQVTSAHVMMGQGSAFADGRRAPPSTSTDRWAKQFAYFDPMSVDIDSASSLILGRRPSPHPPALLSHSPNRVASPATNKPTELSSVQQQHTNNVTNQNTDSYVARSASLRWTPTSVRAGPISRLSSSGSLRSPPRSPTLLQADKNPRDGAVRHIIHSSQYVGPKSEASTHEQNHATTQLDASSPLSEPDAPDPVPNSLSIRTTSIRHRILARSTQVAKSRYRIVNHGEDEMLSTDSASPPSSPSTLSSPLSPFPHMESRPRPGAGFTPLPYKIESLPIPQDVRENCIGEVANDFELDAGIANAVISSWNGGQWEQAKHNIEILSSRHGHHPDNRLSRRLQHLLGVIASISGSLQQALVHFLSVYPKPIDDIPQLDAGHCAAAHWMGDIYAIKGSRTEALLSYSIAARSPLLKDSSWQPLQQQIQTERDLCRSGGVKTGVNISLEHDEDVKTAETILDPRIIARDVARAVVQADRQPSSRDTGKLNPNRSRAMALHDLDMQCESWQEKHKLEIDITAFDPAGPWPLAFDPFFVLENVRRHRLHSPESDLLKSGLSAAKIPKKSRLAFSCQDLRWLIVFIRTCLTRLDIEWSEAIIEHGPKFIARYRVVSDGIATIYFFSIPVYRLSFRPGYGVDICSDGIFSSRVQSIEPKSENGVPANELKRVKKMIKDALETAAKRQEATESRSMTLPVMSINGVTSLHIK